MAAHGNRRATITVRVTYGDAQLQPDPARPAGWTLLIDGVAQSYVDSSDPCHLAFEYVRRLARVVDAAAAPGRPLAVLHLGGGALTLPRYVAATRPGSAQRVVERDPELVALVARVLPPPADVVIEIADARGFVAAAHDHYDVILVDVFAGAAMPAALAEAGFAGAAAGLLRPGGLLAMNLTDVPPLAWSRTQVATLRTAFDDVCLIGGAAMLRGRRAGNLVAVAAGGGELPVRRLTASAARDPEPGRVLHGERLRAFAAGARPRLDTPN